LKLKPVEHKGLKVILGQGLTDDLFDFEGILETIQIEPKYKLPQDAILDILVFSNQKYEISYDVFG
jgi:hypothetical protein